MSNLEEMLDKEIISEIEGLESCPMGTEEHKISVDALAKLLDKSIELKKLEIDCDNKRSNVEFEQEVKLQQMEDSKKDSKIKNRIAIVSILVPACLTVWGTCKTFNFDKSDSVTSTLGRGYLNRFIPKK